MNPYPATAEEPALDLSKWKIVPNLLIALGALLAVIGVFVDSRQFGYSWLLAYMFFLSICLGGLFMVLVHHLFDASWSVPIRRISEHLAFLALPLAVLFLPLGLLAPRLYEWMGRLQAHNPDHALVAKYPLFTIPMFYVVSVFCLASWVFFSYKLP